MLHDCFQGESNSHWYLYSDIILRCSWVEWIWLRFSDQCRGSRWHSIVHCRNTLLRGVWKLVTHIREEHGFRVMENRVLRTVVCVRQEATGWRKWCNGERNLYSLLDFWVITMKEEMIGHGVMYGGEEKCICGWSWCHVWWRREMHMWFW
jgi:hypothetical protein